MTGKYTARVAYGCMKVTVVTHRKISRKIDSIRLPGRDLSALKRGACLRDVRRKFGDLTRRATKLFRRAKQIDQGTQTECQDSDCSDEACQICSTKSSEAEDRELGQARSSPAVASQDACKPKTGQLKPEEAQSTSSASSEDGPKIRTADKIEATSDAVRAQALRLEKYIYFEDECAEDYTGGPVRFVNTFDGVSEAAALLMTLDLSQKIQRAVKAQRSYEEAQHVALSQRRMMYDLEVDTAIEIRVLERRIGKEEQGGDKIALGAAKTELAKLKLMLDSVQLRRQAVAAQYESQALMLRYHQSQVSAVLEEVFVASALLQPRTDEVRIRGPEVRFQKEYQAFCRDLENGGNGVIKPMADLQLFGQESSMSSKSILTPEQQAKRDAAKAFFEARDHLESAWSKFDRRDADRERDRRASVDDTKEAFDVRWVQRYRDLTHAVVEAEAKLAEAKKKAIEAGAEIRAESLSTGFCDGDDDGYRESLMEFLASIPRDKVDAWLAVLPENADPEWQEDFGADEWEARDIDICDSMSLVAEGPSRRQIDSSRWQQACGL